MQFLLGFGPFILFAILSRVSITLALWISFAMSFAVGVNTLVHTRSVRILEGGSVVLFGILAVCSMLVAPGLQVEMVRFVIDFGLLVVALISVAMRKPFTLPYAKAQTPKLSFIWDQPIFLTINYRITFAWIAAFAVMAAADAAALYKLLSLTLDIVVGLAAIVGAIVFTVRYPASVRRKFMGS
jgi:hypothetical protein